MVEILIGVALMGIVVAVILTVVAIMVGDATMFPSVKFVEPLVTGLEIVLTVTSLLNLMLTWLMYQIGILTRVLLPT